MQIRPNPLTVRPYIAPFETGPNKNAIADNPHHIATSPHPAASPDTVSLLSDVKVTGASGLNPGTGTVLDLNHNDRYDRGQDGVLAFDLDNDGQCSNWEINESNNRLKAMHGNYDENNDGKTSTEEFIRGIGRNVLMQQYDKNHDGSLSTSELKSLHARVLIDHDKNGRFSANEHYRVDDFPGYRGRSTEITGVNADNEQASTWTTGMPYGLMDGRRPSNL